MRILIACAVALLATSALAEEKCTIEAGPGDVVSKHGTVTIEAGRKVEDAVALDGDVVVRAGASVKNAVAVHGNVVVEDGATVRKSAVTVGGTVKAGAQAKVHDRVELSDDGLKVKGDDGDDLALNLTVSGESLGKKIVDEVLAKVKHCRVVVTNH